VLVEGLHHGNTITAPGDTHCRNATVFINSLIHSFMSSSLGPYQLVLCPCVWFGCRQNQDGYVQPRNFTGPNCPPLTGPDSEILQDPGEPKLVC